LRMTPRYWTGPGFIQIQQSDARGGFEWLSTWWEALIVPNSCAIDACYVWMGDQGMHQGELFSV